MSDIFDAFNDPAKAGQLNDTLGNTTLALSRDNADTASVTSHTGTNEGVRGHMINRKTAEAEADAEAANTLLTTLLPFRRANPNMTLQTLVSFLLVARNEGKQVTDYARAAGVQQGVMTRNLFALGEYDRNKEPGMGLVEQRPDINDRRAHLTYLTHKGHGVLHDLRMGLDAYKARSK